MSIAPGCVLYVRPDSIGDLVIFSSALVQLQAAWPHARHVLIVRPGYESLAGLFTSGLQWLVAPINPFSEHPGKARRTLAKLLSGLEELAPDMVVAASLNRTWLEVAIAAHFPGARRVALGRRAVGPHFNNALRLELGVESATAFGEVVSADERKTDWDNNHRLVDYLLARSTPRLAPDLTVPSHADGWAARFLGQKNLLSCEFAAIFIGGLANVRIKAWPAEKFAEFLQWLQGGRKVPFLLLGHMAEAGEVERVLACLEGRGIARPPVWLGRKGEVVRLAALLARARCYVGHDTGAMHMAAAVGRPVVGIFGGGHWPRFRPVGRRVLSVVQPLPCFGCDWDCLFKDAPCVKTIGVADVIRAVEKVLDDRRPAYDDVIEARSLSDESIRLIRAVTPLYAAIQDDRVDRMRVIEESQHEASIRHAEIVSLMREAEAKDGKILALQDEASAKEQEIIRLRCQAEEKDAEIAELKSMAAESTAHASDSGWSLGR